ncbi:MAG: hypothetical protein V1913_05995 [Fibrobacterota bacterium]
MPGLYLITGDNTPDRERCVQSVIKKELKGDASGNALQVFHASETESAEIIEAVGSTSLFGGASLTLVRGAEDLASDTLRGLARLLPLPPGNTLILDGKRVGLRIMPDHPFSKAVKANAKSVVEEEFPMPPPYKMGEWVSENAASRYKRRLSAETAKVLLDMAGSDPARLLSEMEKLDIVLPAKAEITEKDIRFYVGAGRSREPWDLLEPVGHKKAVEAFRLLKELYNDNASGIMLVSALGEHFLGLFKLKLHFEENPGVLEDIRKYEKQGFKGKNALNDLLSKTLKEAGYSRKPIAPNSLYPRIILPRVLDQMERYSLDALQYVVQLLASADLDLKTGRMKDNCLAMERLLLFIFYSEKFRVGTIV